ncbi:4251_t:CDS:10 [Entrophospora sp. SA101]|nr:4251_t:CDS:10 [Entrophospora sp. SA101]
MELNYSKFKNKGKKVNILPKNGRCFINEIAVEILSYIFSNLDPIILSKASRVCKHWRLVISDDNCWRNAFLRFFGCAPFRRLTKDSWKNEYIARVNLLRKWKKGKGSLISFDTKVGKIDDLYVDFDNSWMLTGSSDRGIVARCNPKTGKVNKDLISTSGNIVRPISALLVDRNASERYYKKLYDYGSRSGCVTSLARDRKYDNIVVSGSSDGVVKLWDTDLKEDIRNECEKLGEVTNVVLYDKEPEGIVSVKFKDQISAEACVLKMNGRFFAGRRVEAEIFDGKQKYQKTGSKSNETDEEEATRLEKYAKWLEEQNTGTASAKTNTINVDTKQSAITEKDILINRPQQRSKEELRAKN